MEIVAAQATRLPRPAALLRVGVDRPRLGTWLLGFSPVLYLALRGGGYDVIVRSQVGLTAWWVLLVGVLAGALRPSQITRRGWICLGFLLAFTLWSALGLTWTLSAERTVGAVGLLATYFVFLVLALCAVRRANAGALVSGLASAIGLVALLGVLSKLFPGAFPADQAPQFFPYLEKRLNYPFSYADGTGEFLAIGLPLLISCLSEARTLAGRLLASAAIPVLCLAVVMTASRGAVITAAVGIAVFFAVAPVRLPKLLGLLLPAAGAAALIVVFVHNPALSGVASTASQRHGMSWLLAVTLTCVVAGQAWLDLWAADHARKVRLPPLMPLALRRASSRRRAGAAALALAVLVSAALGAGLPGKVDHAWNTFREVKAAKSASVVSRLGSIGGSHRYQYWQSAAQAMDTRPGTGIGPGAFGLYWTQHRTVQDSVQNAHSLYLETLAETGIPGLILLLGFLGTVVLTGTVRAFRAPQRARLILAPALGAFIAFCAAAAFDWVWQLAAIPVAAMLLAAAILAAAPGRPRPAGGTRTLAFRAALGAIAVAGMAAVTIPLDATSALRASQQDARSGDLHDALSQAVTAARVEPYAAAPRLQRALVLERMGDLRGADAAITSATTRESENWQLWLVRARIAAEDGHPAAALGYLRRAHQLDPLSFATGLHA